MPPGRQLVLAIVETDVAADGDAVRGLEQSRHALVLVPGRGQPEPGGRAVAGRGLDPEPPHRVAEAARRHRRDRHGRNPGRVAREEQDLRSGVPLELRGERAVDPERGHDDAVLGAAGWIGHGDADRLVELVPLRRGLDPEPLGGPALECPADEGAAGEIFVGHAALRGPGLEDPRPVHDQHPVGPGLHAQLVGLVEQVAPVVGSKRLADPGDVGGHLDQRRGELAKALASACQRVADGGAGSAERASGGGLRGGVGAGTRDQQRRAQRRHHHERGADEDLPAEGHPQYLRPCCGYG